MKASVESLQVAEVRSIPLASVLISIVYMEAFTLGGTKEMRNLEKAGNK